MIAGGTRLAVQLLRRAGRNRTVHGAFFLIVLGGFLFAFLQQDGIIHYLMSPKSGRVYRQSTEAVWNVMKSLPRPKPVYPLIDLDFYMPSQKMLFNRTRIVTAVSSNHYPEMKKMVATVQMHMPSTKIVVYNLGLTKTELHTISRMCNVEEVRFFNFAQYPRHVRNKLNYAWKPLIIREALYEFGAIFWADSSIRFKKSILPLYRYLKDFHGFVPMVLTYEPNRFSNYNKTHPDMYRYLGVDLDNEYKNLRSTPTVQASRIFFVNSSYITEKLIQPWVACALALDCIAPKGSQNPHRRPVAGFHEHRYDQSALGILIYKNLRGLFKKGNGAQKAYISVSAFRNNNRYFGDVQNVTFCD
ncbi:uncharacterized protein LOC119740481 [Patiria miniata]|uniref:Uncharacterized protein n=1 Tax=Patiria miniata TaxID=46514 RepID=A0A914B6I4_PATMI|nr:uncharacterized protein LOC119740481 [Patiria miniata]